MPPILVIGSGPAGLGASFGIAEMGRKACIYEKLPGSSLRLLASGNTRCNFSNILPGEAFMEKFGKNGSFMRQALQLTPREFFQGLLKKEGVETILEEEFYCFPASGGARAVKEALWKAAGEPVIKNCRELRQILVKEENGRKKVAGAVFRREDGTEEVVAGEKIVLASGGSARPLLGGSEKVLKLLEKLGHSIVTPLPALAPIFIEEEYIRELTGISLPSAGLTLAPSHQGKKLRSAKALSVTGNLLFTHEGLSGFAALELSGEAAFQCQNSPTGKIPLYLHLFPGKKESDFMKIFQEARIKDGAKECVTILASRGLPHALAEKLVFLAGIAPHTKICRLTGKEMQLLASLLEKLPLTVTGTSGMEKAMVMRGGVSLKEVRGDTLESRLIDGLYFAGEILDLDGPCGGYQIQWAFSSGRLAGRSAGEV